MRLAQATEAAFAAQFDTVPDGVWFAPGRVNLIGEHTDYNDGFVLPFALHVGTVAAVRRRTDRRVRAVSLQMPDSLDVAVDELEPGGVDGWAAYVAGVLWALRQEGHDVPGLDLMLNGDVPAGAGLSSSHSLECAVAVAVDELASLDVDRADLARLVQQAENGFVGAPTGIMDQLTSLAAREGHLALIDCRSLAVEQVPFDLSQVGLELLVIDTRSPHALVSGEYAERRDSCERAAGILGVAALRDVPIGELGSALDRLADPVLARRTRHVVTENARVIAVADHLRAGGDPRGIGPALTASHLSMREDFEITVPHVDVAVDAALGAGAHGARMTGGGFGGCVIALVEAADSGTVVTAVRKAYAAAGFDPPVTFTASPRDGASRVRLR